MKRTAAIFLVAVFLPALILGGLALRGALEQRTIIERQASELYQKDVDEASRLTRELVLEIQREFVRKVEEMIAANRSPAELAPVFHDELARKWPRNAVGFAVDLDGRILSPAPAQARSAPEVGDFFASNREFLTNEVITELYKVEPESPVSAARSSALTATGWADSVLSKLSSRDKREIGTRQDQDEVPAAAQPSVVSAPQSASTAAPAPALSPPPVGGMEHSRVAGEAADTAASAEKEKQEEAKKAKEYLLGEEQQLKELPQSPLESQTEAAPELPSPQMDGLTVFEQGGYSSSNGAKDSSQMARGNLSDANAYGRDLAYNEKFSKEGDAYNLRKVVPQNTVPVVEQQAPPSKLKGASQNFAEAVAEARDGVLTRFVQNRLEILVWCRPSRSPNLIFGATLRPDDLSDLWSAAFGKLDVGPDACLALLNEHAKPVYLSRPGFETDWKHPFVATEIGEALPYWEASLYLADPARMASAARQVTYLLFFLIALAIGAIAWGGYLIATETRRQLALVEKKNDFVSNVSHELKTPLTSIRMFAELLEEGRIDDTAKRNRYLRIIRLESERLTRLINNVLDFAKLERNQKRYDKKPVDLRQVCERVWDAQQIGFQQNGFASSWQAAPGPYPVLGDADALAQVVMNLLSNAEKYSNGNTKEIEMQTFVNGSDIMVSVLDRGPGVPKGQEEKIFEQFYRAHDSLHSGIQGSGLGLTLARRIARDHGGDVTYTPRPSGGSNFTLRLPLHPDPTPNAA